jgi:catechol 2,3-dioxygenase
MRQDDSTVVHGTATTDLPTVTALGAVTLAVADLEAVHEFYRNVLGLESRRRGPGWSELGTTRSTLVRLEQVAGSRPAPGAPGLYHLALLVPGRPALGAWLLHALETGVPLQGAADHAVSEAIYLADPEGNGVEVYRDRPRDAWQTHQGRIAMTTEPLDARDLTAAATSSWDGAPDGTTVGHIHLQVGDLARSATFYGDVVGFRRTNDTFPGACFLAAGGYHHHLGLNTWGLRPYEPKPGLATGLRRFEVVVPDEGALTAAGRRLAAAGHDLAGPAGERVLDLTDPDGIGLRVRVTPPDVW